MQNNSYKNYGESLTSGNFITRITLGNFLGFERNYGKILDKLNKDSHILEFGPGNTLFLQYLIIKGFKNIDLIEISDDFFRHQVHAYANFSTIKFHHDEIENYLSSSNKIYDLIISRQVIEHISPEKLGNLFKVCFLKISKKGVLLFETINAYSIPYGFYYRYIDFSHLISFTSKSIKEFALLSGFTFHFNSYEILPSLVIFQKIYKTKNIHLFNTMQSEIDKIIFSSVNQAKNGKNPILNFIMRNSSRYMSMFLTWFFMYSKLENWESLVKTEFVLFEFSKDE